MMQFFSKNIESLLAIINGLFGLLRSFLGIAVDPSYFGD